MKIGALAAASASLDGTARAASARSARRIAKHEHKVLAWWAFVPADARRPHYLGADIADGVGVAMVLLGPALKALGWRREQVRLQGAQIGLWVPPGAPSIKRPVGRPSFSQLCSGGQP
jgi:hypothetical protein